jgi:hypothetical protein
MSATTNLWELPADDEPEHSTLFDAIEAELDYSALDAAEEAAAALGITPLDERASPFERKHHQRQEQASGFNADLWQVLEPLLKDRKAQALAAIAAKELGLEATAIAEETRGFSPAPVTMAHVLLAIIVHKTMKQVQVGELVWSLPTLGNAKDEQLSKAKDLLQPLLNHLVETKVLETVPATRGRYATYALTRRLELARLAADALPVSGIILFLDEEGEVFPLPTQEDIAEGRAIPEIVLSEHDGYVTCTKTGTELPCGLSRWLSVPFITPDHNTIEELYQAFLDERQELLADAAGDEERLKELQEEREPSYWDVLRHYPSHAVTTLVAKDDRGRLLVQADVGQHMTKDIRQHLTFLDGSGMSSADGKAFMLSLTAAILGNCPPAVAEQLNLAPRADGKSMSALLEQAATGADGTTGHRDPYAAVWLSFSKTLKRRLIETGNNPREVVKKASTPAGYGSGQANVARILKRDFGIDRELGLMTAGEVASFPPLGDALKVMRKALNPCASFTGTVSFVYNWTDEHGDNHSFHCETSTTIDNNYVGREWRLHDVLVLRTGEPNLSKARTALLANLNQGIEAWLLECQSAFAAHLGISIWSTHDQTSTNSEYNTRLVTGISATALNAIIEQNIDGMAKCWGLKLPRRTHAAYDPDTPLYVFDNED